MTPLSPSNNLKGQVEELLEMFLNKRFEAGSGSPYKFEKDSEESATRILNLILDTILASLPTDKRLHHYGQYTYLEKDILAMLEGMKS